MRRIRVPYIATHRLSPFNHLAGSICTCHTASPTGDSCARWDSTSANCANQRAGLKTSLRIVAGCIAHMSGALNAVNAMWPCSISTGSRLLLDSPWRSCLLMMRNHRNEPRVSCSAGIKKSAHPSKYSVEEVARPDSQAFPSYRQDQNGWLECSEVDLVNPSGISIASALPCSVLSDRSTKEERITASNAGVDRHLHCYNR